MNARTTCLEHLLGPGGSEKRHAYLTSASFHNAVDTMVGMMPAWVDGMLVACREADAEQRQHEELIRTLRGAPLVERCPECGWIKGFCHCEAR